MKRLKIYIGCSLTGAPDSSAKEVTRLKEILSAHYELLEFVGLDYETTAQVYYWDIEHSVRDCDLFVAICDERSIGLGWELCEAVHLGKPILAVAHSNVKVSGLVLGAAELKPNMVFSRYKNLHAELPKLITQQLAAILSP
jgi:hypothetical protein